MYEVEKEQLTVTVAEAARQYGLCENTFRRIVNRADFPKIKVGRRIVIIKRQLTEYMENLAKNGLLI